MTVDLSPDLITVARAAEDLGLSRITVRSAILRGHIKVVPLDAPPAGKVKRLGFMPGIKVPDDFDTMFQDEIEKMFYGEDDE